jgi:hypothetical protein
MDATTEAPVAEGVEVSVLPADEDDDIANDGNEESEEEGSAKNDGDWNGIDMMPSMCKYNTVHAMICLLHGITDFLLCLLGMNCGEEGMTRLIIQKVPYFRELVIASFYCDHCGESNNDVTFGGEIQV